MKSKISRCDFKWVLISENKYSDSLANLRAAIKFQFRWKVPIEHITNLSIQQPTREVLYLDTSPEWRDFIIAYLRDETLSNDRAEAQKLQHLATRYILFGDTL